MKNSSPSVRLPQFQAKPLENLCVSKGINSSQLFREIVRWVINADLAVPKQQGPYRFRVPKNGHSGQSNTQKTNFHFGAKIPISVREEIKMICKKSGISESHYYRFAVEQYLANALFTATQANVQPFSYQSQGTVPPKFSDPTASRAFKSPELPPFLKQIQEQNIRTFHLVHIMHNLAGLAVIFLACKRKN